MFLNPWQGALERMQALVQRLCAPSCGGRAAGTREGQEARALLIDALEGAGIEPAGPVGYLQPVPGCGGANVLAQVRGSGPYQDRLVLVCAHYDHLGWHTPGQEAFWGADDNAAALAITLELGRVLRAMPAGLGRTVLLCFFDGEEPPFFLTKGMGSEHFASRPTVPLSSIDLMICLDLVGHAVGPERLPAALRQSLFVLGAEKSEGTAALVDGLAEAVPGVRPVRLGIDLLPPLSDYHPFQKRGVPFLFLTCGRWRHYHQVTDTPDRLDYNKMLAIARWLEVLVRQVAQRPEPAVAFLPHGRDDQATLESLWNCLSLLVPWFARGRELLRRVEVLRHAARGRLLTAEELEQTALLVGEVEALLA